MMWAGIDTATALARLVTWGWSARTTGSRVEGDTPLLPLERTALADLLGVHEDVLIEGGPELPDFPCEGMRSVTIVAGEPGHEKVLVVERGKRPETINLDQARGRGLLLTEDSGQMDQPPTTGQAVVQAALGDASEGQGKSHAKGR